MGTTNEPIFAHRRRRVVRIRIRRETNVACCFLHVQVQSNKLHWMKPCKHQLTTQLMETVWSGGHTNTLLVGTNNIVFDIGLVRYVLFVAFGTLRILFGDPG